MHAVNGNKNKNSNSNIINHRATYVLPYIIKALLPDKTKLFLSPSFHNLSWSLQSDYYSQIDYFEDSLKKLEAKHFRSKP